MELKGRLSKVPRVPTAEYELMDSFSHLRVEIDNRVALVTITRPEVLNALNAATLDELEAVFVGRLNSDDVGAVIVTGEGDKAFVAGADIKELAGLDPVAARRTAIRGQRLMELVAGFPRPVIAAINGYCLGGGCELALSCHIRIAAEEAQIGLPEVKLGLIPGYGGTQRLARLVGKGRAMELVLTGQSIGARQAERIGLVNRAVAGSDLMATCRKLADSIVNNASLAITYSIEAINGGLDMPLREASRLEAAFFGLSCATEDMKEGMLAFTEKRKPRFKGR